MSIHSFLADLFGRSNAGPDASLGPRMSINSATGLPMLGGAIDVAGNPYGTDIHRHDDAPSSPSCVSDHHHHAGSLVDNDWSSSSWSGVSSSWPDHSSTSGGGYDRSLGS